MSIYDAIANSGQNAGAGINAYAQGKYQRGQMEQKNAMLKENQQYERGRNTMSDQNAERDRQESMKQQALSQAVQMSQGGATDDVVLGFLNQESQRMGLQPADPAVIQQIHAMAQGAPQRSKGAPVQIVGEGGRPQFAYPDAAVGKEAYVKPPTPTRPQTPLQAEQFKAAQRANDEAKLADPSSPENIQKSKQKAEDQLSMLQTALTKARSLKDAAGPSGISKVWGDMWIGDTDFRRLEAVTNTLRTNVLTLMTDPSIKKFFGPQMSEADVRLMTAGGTTLNPESQSPEDMEEELIRLESLFNRMSAALPKTVGRFQVLDVTSP